MLCGADAPQLKLILIFVGIVYGEMAASMERENTMDFFKTPVRKSQSRFSPPVNVENSMLLCEGTLGFPSLDP